MKKISTGIYLISKKLGETPLEAIHRLKKKFPRLKNDKATYAGRLDPMATGLLLILMGKKVYEKEKYLALDKEYEAEVLLGFTTDTLDLLGVPQRNLKCSNCCKGSKCQANDTSTTPQQLKRAVATLAGRHSLPVPAYSSVPLSGTPLFALARAGTLKNIKIPKRLMTVYSARLTGIRKIKAATLEKQILKKLAAVHGDFRQTKIIGAWKKVFTALPLAKNDALEFIIISAKFRVASGTYIRTLASELGKRLGTGGILYSLKRTKIGTFSLFD